MTDSFPNSQGRRVLVGIIDTIESNGAMLSEIDGATGDGDHGINMSKGARRTREVLGDREVMTSEGLEMLGNVLLTEIGGAMGPLYGSFFNDMGGACKDKPETDKEIFGRMLDAAVEVMTDLGGAKIGDKTIMDALLPAHDAYRAAVAEGADFPTALRRMADAAEQGKESTRHLVAKLGRASRLGERSRGTLDAGATSCALILRSFADTLGGGGAA